MRYTTKDTVPDKHLTALIRMQTDFSVWHESAIAHAFYQNNGELPPAFPSSFARWLSAAQTEGIIDTYRLESLVQASQYLQSAALTLGQKKPPAREIFTDFCTALEKFSGHLRFLVKVSVLEDYGIDSLTGLYSASTMYASFKEELDRLARRGQPFVIVLSRIDNYVGIARLGYQETTQVMQTVARQIMDTLRVFDDAYRSGDGEFVLCLKQIDIHAATTVMDRLHATIKACGLSFEGAPLTLTSCLLSPLPGDNFTELLASLRRDLRTANQDLGAVLLHHETSPLERLVKGKNKKD